MLSDTVDSVVATVYNVTDEESDFDIIWSVENSDIISISEVTNKEILITAKRTGYSTITATLSTYPDITSSIAVRVYTDTSNPASPLKRIIPETDSITL